ncbi:tripartite tricarboxylate transporter family receptor [Variibacter gotjawalensis]|uniref:Tripartite tricarboxylate transporter family receptor n=1 Tax=Variibacter gotjawalensis TaxID=1333996 RepID=A0A0S3PU03_9BRAD|nr:tripartite tricarboxylate transporter substrate-binding protein [Variibacter gotjawalensis]NIK49665.1 tripartite-type tricarboxylate transporter receptor subunit TctC [Variibacter gotjawalensis]RZS45677.1 tripartite-type tricarboxylate transporter receptor subunit TctC [Variibacter gotjawalensis]BAT59348.1 tripartite tricarboxylate transporter family receptor [Variibacter gotjawalensis]
MRTTLLAGRFALLSVTVLFGLSSAIAQEYPTRPITVIVPFAAGGTTDVVTRVVAEHMSRTLGQQLVIENASGAGGTTGTTKAKRATPDGYTIMTGQMGTHAAAVGLYANLQYDPRTDFEPLGQLAGTPILVLGRKELPAKDLKEFVAYVKANAGKLNNGHAGVGSVSYTGCLLLNHLLGVKPALIPFNGSGPTMNALVASQVDYMCDQSVNVVPQVQGGTIKAYAVATPERNPALPDVPTTAEAGMPEFQASAWNAMFAPKGTPRPIVEKLNAAIVAALGDEGVRKRMLDLGLDIPSGSHTTPEALGELVRSEIDKWTPIIKAAGKQP